MNIPKTNGDNFFVGASDTNGNAVPMNAIAITMNLQLDAMTTVALRCSSGRHKTIYRHSLIFPSTTSATNKSHNHYYNVL